MSSENPAHPELEFWFEFASNYTYLSVMRIEREAERRGVSLLWRPFLLGPIFRELGMETSPFILQKEKGAYMWQDMARQCAKYGLPWMRPSQFPRSGLLPARIAIAFAGEPWIGAFSRRIMARNFAEDRAIDQPEHVTPALTDLGLPAAEVLSVAASDANKERLKQQTQEARDRGIFGAPTFFVAGQMFWGNDRLDDALDYAASLQRGKPP